MVVSDLNSDFSDFKPISCLSLIARTFTMNPGRGLIRWVGMQAT